MGAPPLVSRRFYAPWCGHCQKLAPDWRKVEKAHGPKSPLLVGSVDCSDGPPQPGAGGPGGGGRNPLCDKYKAMSLPTLMYFNPPSNKGFTYEGNKTVDEMLAFASELGSACAPAKLEECSESQTAWLTEYNAMETKELKEKAQELMMQGDMAKMGMMMMQMQMQQEYQKVQGLPEAVKEAKMKTFEKQGEDADRKVSESWAESGRLRAMRMVLQERDPAVLKEIDAFDMMDSMMGGGPGGGAGRSPAKSKDKKKKKKKKAASKDEV